MKKDMKYSSSINEYFSWVEQNIPADTALCKAAKVYREEALAEKEEKDPAAPFLTVITRTQGKRPDMLCDVLLSLTGQSNTDFELLIMAHNVTEEQKASVSELIDELPEWMRQKTRLVPVVGGTRSTPLNAGFAEARGSYVAVLDDDDLIFDHWVETFYQLSQKYEGRILHSYSVIQDWETVGKTLPNTPRVAGAPENTYCCDFDYINQLGLNKCPFCALAFPASLYKKMGLRFDETLTTTEDWDFLMRSAFLVGVADSSEITFLYRNWLNAENSSSLHAQEEWRKNSNYVVKRFSKTPIILPVGGLKKYYDEILEADALYSEDMDNTEMFYDDGSGIAPDKLLRRKNSFDHRKYPFVYDAGGAESIKLCGIRFDPRLKGNFSLKHLLISVVKANDEVVDFGLKDIRTNGYILKEKILFVKSDPQIVLHFSSPMEVKEVRIGCVMKETLTDAELDAVLLSRARFGGIGEQRRSFAYRVARKLYRIVKRVFSKHS